MKAQELRIGNCMHETLNNRNVRIQSIEETWEDVRVNYANGAGIYSVKMPHIEPIPLTEEILKDWCGFVKTYMAYSIDLPNDERIDVRKDGTAALWASDGCTEGHCLHINCKYLHQLQNLYFALTGEELKIKLPTQ